VYIIRPVCYSYFQQVTWCTKQSINGYVTTYNEQVEIVKNATKQMLNRIYQKREYNHDLFGQKKIGRTTLGISKGEKKNPYWLGVQKT
jgi:hypothetical protein